MIRAAMDDRRFVGLLLEERYEVLRPLARGGMGQVYVAHDKKLAVDVAVKFLVLRDGSTPSADLEQRFEGEAKILAKVRDPRVLRPLSWGRTPDGVMFMVTELLEGRPLDALLREEGTIDALRAVRILVDVCRALAETHGAGVLHRDLKPANLFLQRSRGGEERTVVLDFGIAKIAGDPAASPDTTPGVVLGTVSYMSPEQARAKNAVPQSDLYALGVVMYECLIGAPPFEGDSVHVMLAHVTEPVPTFESKGRSVDPELESIVRWMLEKEIGSRPVSATAVLSRTEKLLAKLAPPRRSSAPAQAPAAPPAAPAASSAWPLWLGGIGAVVAAVWLGLDLLAPAKPAESVAPIAAPVSAAPASIAPALVVTATPARSLPPSPTPVVTAKPTPVPRGATVTVTSRVGLLDSAGNTQSLSRASDAIRPCLRGAPLPLEIALAVLQDGSVKVALKDIPNVQACAQAAVANIRFELSGSMGVIKLRAAQ